MDPREMRIHVPLYYTLHNSIDPGDDIGGSKSVLGPKRTYIQDANAIVAPADFIEYRNSLVFLIDMPGLMPGDVRVTVEYGNVLTIYGERKGGVQQEGADYRITERKFGKFFRTFPLPGNADTNGISGVYREGVLTVTLQKLPPPTPETSKTAEITGA